MRLYNIYGRSVTKNVTKYLIDWDAKSRSKLQFDAKQFFRQYWSGQVVYEEFPVFGTRMKVDILNATKRIAIEVNGEQHDKFNKFFHNNSRAKYLDSIKRDMKKAEWLEKNSFTLIEIYKKDIKDLSRDFFKQNFLIEI
tara:strand:- start:992 stop:1408 length:417 start_codon:yes stop_codon:yes gene_type:complete